MHWFDGLSVQVQAALIGAVVALVGFVLRDLIIRALQERRDTHKSYIAIFKKYGDPILTASTSLLWRLNEVFNDEGRGDYLKSGRDATRYEKYKQKSTLYRLACVLAWKHALERELSFLPVYSKKKNQAVQLAFHHLEKSLADGPHVEQERLTELSKLWQLTLPEDERKLYRIGVALDKCVHETVKKSETWEHVELDENERLKVCEKASKVICEELHVVDVPNSVIRETMNRAIRIIFRKEAWLYRDWQAGIGSLMVKETSRGERIFEVVGYKEFEEMWEGGNEEQKRWLERLEGIIKGVDVSGTDRFDARVGQLSNLLKATARLVLSLSDIRWYKGAVSEETKNRAKLLSK